MSRGYIWRKICGITIAAVLFLACGVSEAAKEQTIQVGLAKDKSQYTITANAPFLVTDAAGKKVFLKLRSGEKAMIKADREGLYVNGKKLSVQKISVALDGKAKKGFLNMDGNLYRGSLAISCVKSKQQAKPKAAVKGNASQNKKTASVSLTKAEDKKDKNKVKDKDKKKDKHSKKAKSDKKKASDRSSDKDKNDRNDKKKSAVKSNDKNKTAADVDKKSTADTQTEERTKLLVVNHVGLEEYLFGVVPNEMSPSWPSEALKAQAVAARTFVLHDLKKHASEGYNVCATTHCQVYRGQKSERASTNEAVTATAGEYLVYNGKTISSLFHASGGGYTENSEYVWGGNVPYLRGVADYDQKSTVYQWETKLTTDKLSSILESRGKGVGAIRAIKLSKLEEPPVKEEDRGVSGRVRTMTIEGENGSVRLSGLEVRSMLGLKSTLFDFDKREFSDEKNETMTIRGFGYGHGLGMSQWGAKAMAEKGENKEGLYREILEHYYQGAELKNK